MVIRLYERVIKVVCNISNGEHPNLCVYSSSVNCRGAQTVYEGLCTVDFTAYGNFLNDTSLQSSNVFMNAKAAYLVVSLRGQQCNEKEAKGSTVSSTQHLITRNGFRSSNFVARHAV